MGDEEVPSTACPGTVTTGQAVPSTNASRAHGAPGSGRVPTHTVLQTDGGAHGRSGPFRRQQECRVLWISCLLIGSITCLPVQDPGSDSKLVWPQYQTPWYQGTGGSDQGSDQSGGTGGYVGGDWFHSGHAGGSQGSTGASGDGGDEPFFSDTSDLDKVYAFSSRSRYQRGRAMFAQTRYTPTEPLYPSVPIFKYPGDHKAPVKGVF
nr:PREDICTED: uncharacterized protein LOC103374778 [Stegastes partitus]